jgi:hypothetical protein
MTLHNIEKSAFRKGEYVGYGGGKVWHIRKTNSSHANWFAYNRDKYNEQLWAMRLIEMQKQLETLVVNTEEVTA